MSYVFTDTSRYCIEFGTICICNSIIESHVARNKLALLSRCVY